MDAVQELEFTEIIQPEMVEGSSLLNDMIDLVPFELHVPGYRFLGPGTALETRLERGDKPLNPLDEAAKCHDIVYSKKNKSDRASADRTLAEKAFLRLLADDASRSEKSAALLTVCCMLSKIAFEKFFTRVKNSLRCGDRKKKNKKNVKKDCVKSKKKVSDNIKKIKKNIKNSSVKKESVTKKFIIKKTNSKKKKEVKKDE